MAEKKLSGRFLKGIKGTFKTETKCDAWDDPKSILTKYVTPEDISKHDSAKLLDSEWLWLKEESESSVESDQYNKRKSAQETNVISLPAFLHQSDCVTENGARQKFSKQRKSVDLKKRESLHTLEEEKIESSDNEEEVLLNNDYTSDYETMPKEIFGNDYSSNDEDDENLYSTFSKSVSDLRAQAGEEEEIEDLRPHHHFKYVHIEKSESVLIAGANGTATVNKGQLLANNVELRHLNILNTVRETKHKVETELFKGGQKYLNRKSHHQLVIFKGSGYGCSFSAKMLFEKIVSDSENEAKPYYLKDPKEMIHISAVSKAVIFVSDINGPTGGDIGRLNGWYEWLKEYMPVGTSAKGKLIVVMNLQDCYKPEERNHPIYQRYSEYIVDAVKKEFRPTTATKSHLLTAFMKQKNVEASRIRGGSVRASEVATLIDKEILDGIIPLLGSVRCVGKLAELFRSDLTEGLNILTKPIPEIVQRIRKSYEEGGSLFLTLLAVYAHGGQLGVGEVNQMRKLNEQCEKFWYSADNIDHLPRGKSRKIEKWFNSKSLLYLYRFAKENNHLLDLGNKLQKYARALDGEFLSEYNQVFRFCDGRVHYSFLLVYCEKFSDALEHCEDQFFFNFVHSERLIQEGENDVVLKVNDRKLDVRTRAVMKRFENEMMARHVAKCMRHPLMSTAFFQLFLMFLEETKHLQWKILTQQDCDPTEPYSCLYHGMEKEQDTFKGVPRNITEVIILRDIWKRKRNKKKWKKWIHTQETETLIHAVEKTNFQTFTLMVEKGAQIQKPALLKAIDVGAEKIIEFIQQNGQFNTQETFEIAQYAAEKISKEPGLKSESLVQILLRLISTVNVGTSSGEIPPLVHYAVQTNNAAMLQKLFDGSMGTSHVNVNENFKGERPLTMALRLGFEEVTAILLDNSAKPTKNDAFLAVTEGQTVILQQFIKQYSHILYTTNNQGQTFLHVSAEKGHSKLIRELIELGLSVNTKDFKNETPLSLACKGKHMHSIRIILQAWKQRGFNQDEMVVMRAVQNGDIELMELLMEYGFGVDFVNREFGVPLHVAIQFNLREMFQFLLSTGADPNIAQDGHRPIHIAAAKDDIESLLLLKEYKVNLLALTDTYDSIIHLAADKKHANFIEAVLKMPECSPLIDSRNCNRETALHIACKHGSVVLTKLLLRIGFNPKLPNKTGLFPEALAEQQFKRMKDCKVVQRWAPYAECLNILQTWHS